MRVWAPMLATVLLAGCAEDETVTQMQTRPPYKTYTSTHQPSEVAQCIADKTGGLKIDQDEFGYTVSEGSNGPVFYWEIKPAPTGSAISVWRARNVVRGTTRAEVCFS